MAELKDEKPTNSRSTVASSPTSGAQGAAEVPSSTATEISVVNTDVEPAGAHGSLGVPAAQATPAPGVIPTAPGSQGSPPPSASDQILQAAITQIETMAEQARQRVSWFSLSNWKRHLDPIETAADNCVNRLLTATLSTATCETKKELLEVVKDRRSKIPLSTGITDQIIGICQSLLAFGAGGLGLSIAFIDKASALSVPVQKYLAIAGIFYVELVIVSVLALMLYMIQARFRYPSIYFKKIGNAWPWFYYASISPDVPRWPIQPSPMRLKASALYAKDFVNFTTLVLNEDYTRRLRNEIQQYFLLMSYQGYVNQFSLRLANFFMYGFAGAFISMLIMLVLVIFFGF